LKYDVITGTDDIYLGAVIKTWRYVANGNKGIFDENVKIGD